MNECLRSNSAQPLRSDDQLTTLRLTKPTDYYSAEDLDSRSRLTQSTKQNAVQIIFSMEIWAPSNLEGCQRWEYQE